MLYPYEDISTSDSSVQIQGKAEPETEITINEDSVLQDAEGYFSRVINLKPGLNVITVVGQKKYSKEKIITRNIKVITTENKDE